MPPHCHIRSQHQMYPPVHTKQRIRSVASTKFVFLAGPGQDPATISVCTDPVLFETVLWACNRGSLWVFEYKPIEFGLLGHINSVFIVFDAPGPLAIVLVGVAYGVVGRSHTLAGFYILTPSKRVIEPTPATIKRQHSRFSHCQDSWGGRWWRLIQPFGEFNHVIEIMMPTVSTIKFGYSVFHFYSNSERRAVCPQPCVLYYHTPSVTVRPKPVKYTCRNADGTRWSWSTWWAETVGCMW